MISTGGYGVQVMPNISWADGAQLAGRGPGEAISGFNSGIGLVNAIQNTRQKAILSPIEVDTARARLAQIQAETELNQANAPYRNALAKIEMTKASMPIRQKTGETIKGFAEVDADGKPTGRVHQAVQDEGFDYDPQTGAKTPYTAISRPLVTADQAALNTSLMENRTALAEINRQKAVAAEAAQAARAKQLDGMFTVAKQNADINQQNADTRTAAQKAAEARGVTSRQAPEIQWINRIAEEAKNPDGDPEIKKLLMDRLRKSTVLAEHHSSFETDLNAMDKAFKDGDLDRAEALQARLSVSASSANVPNTFPMKVTTPDPAPGAFSQAIDKVNPFSKPPSPPGTVRIGGFDYPTFTDAKGNKAYQKVPNGPFIPLR